jgi:hypothetical protein
MVDVGAGIRLRVAMACGSGKGEIVFFALVAVPGDTPLAGHDEASVVAGGWWPATPARSPLGSYSPIRHGDRSACADPALEA